MKLNKNFIFLFIIHLIDKDKLHLNQLTFEPELKSDKNVNF